jgi:hypothetical protein
VRILEQRTLADIIGVTGDPMLRAILASPGWKTDTDPNFSMPSTA